MTAGIKSSLYIKFVKSFSDESQNGFKGLKLKSFKFLKPFAISCEQDCFCLKALKFFLFKCLRPWSHHTV